MPASDHAYFATPFAALAHRGGLSPGVPAALENSLRAFLGAWRLGFTHLETDVHLTADGVLVAFHDDVLDRTTDARGRLADLPWDAVREARIGGSEPIPTLDELLAALPEARFNIDLKAPGTAGPLARVLDRHAAHDRVCVASFTEAHLRAFRRLSRGRVATSASPPEVAAFAWAAPLRPLWPRTPAALQVPVRAGRLAVVTPSLVRAAHRWGLAVHVWTINERAEMERLIDLGVDGLVSDELDILKSVLVERGLWEGHA